jgi:hypothetical protein
MKEIKTNNYKVAQEEHKEVNPSYNYEWFWEEVMESGGPNKLHFVGDMKSQGDFDQSYRDEYDPRTEIHTTPSELHGTETNEVNVDIEGIIECPRVWLQNQSIKELESQWNSDLGTCPECYSECYGTAVHESTGTEETVWDKIGCALNEFENIHDVSRESSYCGVSINSLESVNETQAKISFHVDAQVEASGDMPDPRDIY